MRDIVKNRWKKLFYVLIVIGAFWLGHQYGEQAASFIDEVPVPKVIIEMPSNEIETPVVSDDEVRG
jgi:hypothetical protein|tara:strand:+ start:122 stop:319 length:198 start_codon:yes stop_codon:yes gene_type:complete